MHQKAHKSFSFMELRRHYTDPHELYNALRAHDPLYFDPASQSWLITDHRVATTILSDIRFTSELGPSSVSTFSSLHKQMLFSDGEAHRRIQQLMLRPLAQLVKTLPPYVDMLVNTALHRLKNQGAIDIIEDLASPVSLLAIASILGIPLENREELQQLERWSDTYSDITSGYFRGDMNDIRRLESYFRELVRAKKQPGPDTLINTFIEAKDAFSDEDELIANCVMVFAAGRVTTKKLLGNGIPILLQHWQKAHMELPDTSKLLCEELLRLVTPTRYLIRQAREDVDFSQLFPGNHLVQQGQKAILFLEAANRDPAVFTQPESFDPHRRPNKHIAFGFGAHQCPGAMLARLEIQIVLERLRAFSHLHTNPHVAPTWNPNPNLGGFTSYSVITGPDTDTSSMSCSQA